MTQIVFLGTAGSTGVVNRQLRSAGGFVLKVGDLQFHVDPGPGTMNKAQEYGVNVHHNTAVLVSNNNIMNCNDLNIVVDAMTHSGLEQRGIVLGSKSVLQQTEHNHPFLTQHHRQFLEKVIPLEKDHKVGVDIVEINALPASYHHDETAVGFKFYCPKFTLSYAGDTAVTDELLQSLVGTDVLVLKVPYPGDKGKGKELDSEGAIKIISHVRPRLAILTHFSLDMLRADPLHQAREIQRITGVQTIAAQEGLMISPEGYGKYRSPIKGYS